MIDAKEWRLTTDRLVLRHFTEEDWEGFHAYWSDWEVTRFLGIPPKSAAQTKSNLLVLARLPKDAVECVTPLAIALKQSNFVIGSLTIGSHGDCGVLSCQIAQRHWNHGYATEACRRALDYMFGQLHVAQVEAESSFGNTRYTHILTNLGFELYHGAAYTYQLSRKRWSKWMKTIPTPTFAPCANPPRRG